MITLVVLGFVSTGEACDNPAIETVTPAEGEWRTVLSRRTGSLRLRLSESVANPGVEGDATWIQVRDTRWAPEHLDIRTRQSRRYEPVRWSSIAQIEMPTGPAPVSVGILVGGVLGATIGKIIAGKVDPGYGTGYGVEYLFITGLGAVGGAMIGADVMGAVQRWETVYCHSRDDQQDQ